jgi:hypothetical protein
MILISHRGNINGKFESYENEPNYIDLLYLGHDKPQYGINFRWIQDRFDKLWIHCKNVEAVVYFKECGYDVNYFWHQEDTLTLTSKNHLWVYPGKQPINKSIAVMPEIHNEDTTNCFGVCSDYIENYK